MSNNMPRSAVILATVVTCLNIMLIASFTGNGCAVSLSESDRIRMDASTKAANRVADEMAKVTKSFQNASTIVSGLRSDVNQHVKNILDDVEKHKNDITEAIAAETEDLEKEIRGLRTDIRKLEKTVDKAQGSFDRFMGPGGG